MIKNRVVVFEMPASISEQAQRFYETVFDWKVELRGNEGAMAYAIAVDKGDNPREPGGITEGF